MALQSTMGPANELYVTKSTFYWSVGVIILLLAAISFSMSRDISRLSIRTADRAVISETLSAGLPPVPVDTVNQTPAGVNPDVNANPDPGTAQ